eukprot:2683939-Ditylum_brightwellii.AAC.1
MSGKPHPRTTLSMHWATESRAALWETSVESSPDQEAGLRLVIGRRQHQDMAAQGTTENCV